MARFVIVPQWQGSPSSRAMQLVDGAQAIAGDLPRASTTVLDVPMEAGESLDTGIHRLSALQRVRGMVAEALAAGKQELAASSLDAQFNALEDVGELTEVEARLAALKTGGAPVQAAIEN